MLKKIQNLPALHRTILFWVLFFLVAAVLAGWFFKGTLKSIGNVKESNIQEELKFPGII